MHCSICDQKRKLTTPILWISRSRLGKLTCSCVYDDQKTNMGDKKLTTSACRPHNDWKIKAISCENNQIFDYPYCSASLYMYKILAYFDHVNDSPLRFC